MKKLIIKKITPGSFPTESFFVDKVKLFANCFIEVTEKNIYLRNENYSFISNLHKTDEDGLSITYEGKFEDGIKFRVVRDTELTLNLSKRNGYPESLSIGSLHLNGYAVHFEVIQEVPELQKLAEKATNFFESNSALSKKTLNEFYQCYLIEPNKIWNCSNLYKISQCFSMILEWRLVDDIDTIQQVASIGFLICNKAIESDPSNKYNILIAKMFLMRNGRMGLIHTVTNCFNANTNYFSFMNTLSPFRAKGILMSIEFSILQDNPSLYNRLPVFARIKKELDDKILEGFFNPATTKEEVIRKGRESDIKLYSYLVDKVIKNQDIYF